jgi:hypothetical protein
MIYSPSLVTRYSSLVTSSLRHFHLAYPVCGFFEDRCLIPGSRSRVPGTWYRIPGTGSTPRAGHRAPRTETGARYPVPETWYRIITPSLVTPLLRHFHLAFLIPPPVFYEGR